MSAPRIPNDINYWLKKGKSGKNVCLIFHDDLDGATSAIIIKNYLLRQGFIIKKYGVINYQESWDAFSINKELIIVAVDFSENREGVDIYIDHHGKFDNSITRTQKQFAIKTQTDSAAEGIALQLGVSFSNDTKDWIDMIDSAKYSEYEIDIKGILEFDLKDIVKSKNSKLKFAASFNQLIKRGDHKTLIEVVHSSQEPSIYNIYRLFKLFYPKNNPNWISGSEPEFVEDGKDRILQMQKRTKGESIIKKGFNEDGSKKRYMSQEDFWKDFANNLPYAPLDEEGYPIEIDKNNPDHFRWQLKPGIYQLIGNVMYVPSGTWANALRAKSIFHTDLQNGEVPNDPKLNFTILQYGNTIQFADLNNKIKKMNADDLPKDKEGNPISHLGKYADQLVANFKEHLNYKDSRTASGGHDGIGTISNIFGICHKAPFEGVKFLDLFKNKIINDLSGVNWKLKMAWNEEEEKKRIVKPDEINKKLINIEDVRSENEAINEKVEREVVNNLIVNSQGSFNNDDIIKNLKDIRLRNIYELWLETNFEEIKTGTLKSDQINNLYWKQNKSIEKTILFNKIIKKFNLTDIYLDEAYVSRGEQRKELKCVMRIIFNMLNFLYITKESELKTEKWLKNMK
jgi:hypothetical protein